MHSLLHGGARTHIRAEVPVAANAARNRADVKWDKSVRAQAAARVTVRKPARLRPVRRIF